MQCIKYTSIYTHIYVFLNIQQQQRHPSSLCSSLWNKEKRGSEELRRKKGGGGGREERGTGGERLLKLRDNWTGTGTDSFVLPYLTLGFGCF